MAQRGAFPWHTHRRDYRPERTAESTRFLRIYAQLLETRCQCLQNLPLAFTFHLQRSPKPGTVSQDHTTVGSASSPTSGKANRREYCKWDIAPAELCFSHHHSRLEQQGKRGVLCPWPQALAWSIWSKPEAPVNHLSRTGQDHYASAHPLCCW